MEETKAVTYDEYQKYKKEKKIRDEIASEEKKGPAVASFVCAMISLLTFIVALFYAGITIFITPITSIISLAYAKKAKGVKTQPHKTFVGIAIPCSIVCLIISLLFLFFIIVSSLLGLVLLIICCVISLVVGLLVFVIPYVPMIIAAAGAASLLIL